MKGALMSVSDKVLLRKRAIIESVNALKTQVSLQLRCQPVGSCCCLLLLPQEAIDTGGQSV